MTRCILLWCLVVLTVSAYGQERSESEGLVFLAFGDVNLGRSAGKELLKGNLDYPFELVRDLLQQADLVFVNLESQLTDQGGETQHPQFKLIFCGPPQGAISLKRAKISVVSTANNHSFDYRMKGLEETIRNLTEQGIAFTGTSLQEVSEFEPAIIERNNIRVGFLAFTQSVNIPGPWKGRISLFDEQRARREIETLRSSADYVVVSFHAGPEYADRPDRMTLQQMRLMIDAGADLVLGHHPHVPQGVESYRDKLIFYSLGNFVFHQPQREWTQKAFGVKIKLQKRTKRVSAVETQLIPVKVGKVPSTMVEQGGRLALVDRVRKLSSTVEIIESEGSFIIQAGKTRAKE